MSMESIEDGPQALRDAYELCCGEWKCLNQNKLTLGLIFGILLIFNYLHKTMNRI